MKKTFVVCFEVTGGISVEAESADEALAYFYSEDGQEAVGMCLQQNGVSVTEIYEDEE